MLLAATAQSQTEDDVPLPEPEVRAELSADEITVGDPLVVTLELVWPAGAPDVDPRFPAWQDSWGDAEVLAASEVERRRDAGGRTLFTQEVTVTAFAPGEVVLPPLAIALPLGDDTRETHTPDELGFVVASVLPPEDADETVAPRPPSGLERLPLGRRFLITAAVLAVLCALLAVAVARRHPEAFGGLLSPPRPPPLDELLASLETIGPETASEPAHTRMSLALRIYLGRAAGVHAAERTTTEIQRLLLRGQLPPVLAQRVVELLRRCDEAKFIDGFEASPEVVAERRRETEAIARAIERELHPPEEEPAETPASPPPRGGTTLAQGPAPSPGGTATVQRAGP